MSSDLEDLCAIALLCRLMQVAKQGSRNAIRDILVKLPTCLIFPDQHLKYTHHNEQRFKRFVCIRTSV